jgi:hypothetical protein
MRGDLNRAPRLLQNCDVARTRNRPRGSPIAHGRKAVRTQSAILDKNNLKPLLPLSGTVFLVRMVSIRTKNTVGARARNGHSSQATLIKTPYMEDGRAPIVLGFLLGRLRSAYPL